MKGVVAIIFSVLFTSCFQIKKVDESELRKFINDEKNGLKKIIESNQVNLTVTYKPADLLALNEIKNRKEKTELKVIDSIVYNYSSSYFFSMSFSMNGKSLITQVASSIKEDVLNKLNYGLKENIYVTYNSTDQKVDTLQLSDYMYVSMFGASNSDDVIISVNNKQLQNKEQFCLNIKDLSEIGVTEKITFQTKDIEKLPRLNFNKF